MEQEDLLFLRDFFRAVSDQALDPSHPYYVPIYDHKDVAEDDPVELMARAVEWTPGESVQLFSGFRGTGKSTELRRLMRRLQNSGYLVVFCDIEDYVNLSTPIDVSDFLMAVGGAFGEAVTDSRFLGQDPAHESYWERFWSFLEKTEIDFDSLKLKLGPPGLPGEIQTGLKSDPTFKKKLQKTLAGHLGSLVQNIREYVRETVRRLKAKHGPAVEIVLLVDSLEHLRGTSANAEEVHRSVETLLAGHADKLHLPNLHVVYTAPPFVKVRYPNLGSLYTPGGLQMLPAVKLHDGATREEFRAGFEILVQVVGARGDWKRLLGRREHLEKLIRFSGGHLRDLLRLLAEVIRRAENLPVGDDTVDAAIAQVRNEFLPIANQDAVWLQDVAETHSAELDESDRLPDLARFLDTHMVLCYRNGHEWYDVHPLIAETVERQAARRRARSPSVVPE